MKIIVLSLVNRLLSGAIIKYLRECSEIMPIRVSDFNKEGEPTKTCEAHKANILLMEASRISPFTLEERLITAERIRKSLPQCKIAILCDENADPDVAEGVKEAKKTGRIDSFFYCSVTGEYLVAMLDAL